ncbi:MAG: hypothetical protein OXH83_12300 [Bryobacterales bacterium]|nr:hypothetical protein [Bryobacterales bacterium]
MPKLLCDIAKGQDLCRDAILRVATSGEVLDIDDWSAIILGRGA